MSDGERDRRASERDAADRRYNDALTRVDRALPRLPDTASTGVPVAVDTKTVRDRAVILPAAAPDAPGLRGRLTRFVWGLVGPVFTRQQELNASVADQLQQVSDSLKRIAAALPEARTAQRVDLEAFVSFNSILVQYLQQITPFIDTRVRVLEDALEDVRMAATTAQRAATAARRKSGDSPAGAPAGSVVVGGTEEPLDAPYVGFEDMFRGTRDEIRARQADYADRLVGASDVVDIGCGRGELLELLRDRGVSATGVDANAEMVEECRARGLLAVHADALTYLRSVPDESVGGLTALQVVEHLDPNQLVRFLELAFAKLRPGATIVLETINAACWVAFFESYIRDLTHVRPLHPDTLKFLVVAAGFEHADVHFRSPIAEGGRLQRANADDLVAPLTHVVQTMNANVDRLNERLFTYLDYAVIAAKGR